MELAAISEEMLDPSRPARSVALWSHDARLVGAIAWGWPSAEDFDRLEEAVRRSPGGEEWAFLLDARRLAGLGDPMVDRVLGRPKVSEPAPAKLALLVAPGVAGALLTGLVALVFPAAARGVFTSLGEALGWLGRPDAGERLGPALERLGSSADGGSPLVARLRGVLRTAGLGLDLADVARHLGVSARTLQRELRAQGTTFRQERVRERAETAAGLLVDTDLKIETIAERVGFAAAPQFTTFFRTRTGLPPDRWRRAARQRR
jgi:AraC-like DNA-binding protein